MSFAQKKYDLALKYCQPAAEQGDPEAQYYLGIMYNKGFGLNQDYTEAMKWYLKAAEQDNKDALCSLANMYLEGEGVKQDYTEARNYFIKAANLGDAAAQYNLGVYIENGDLSSK